MWETPFPDKLLGKTRLQPSAAVIGLQNYSRGEHVCAVRDDLCDVISWEMLFSRLFNWLLAKVICGHRILPGGVGSSAAKAKADRLWLFKSAFLKPLR